MKNKDRYFIIDFFRFVAIILMFITHTYRIQISNFVPDTNIQLIVNNTFNFFMYIEPFTSALFLFLVGFSIKMSLDNTKLNIVDWKRTHLKKGFKLILISFLLYIPYHSFNIKIYEIIFSSGILSVIGTSLITISLLKERFLYLFFIIVLVISFFLESCNINIIGLNAGAGNLFPTMLYSLIGYFSYNYSKVKIKFIDILLIIIFIGIIFTIEPNFRYNVYYHEYNFNLLSLKIDQSFSSIWNHSIFGFIFNSFILFICSKLFLIKTKITNKLITTISKYSLQMYIFHILLLSGFYITKIGFPNSIFTLIFLLILIPICLNLSKIYLKIKSLLTNA